MNLAELQHGVIIAALGMGLVFLALGLLIVAMWALERAFRPAPQGTPEPVQGPTPTELAAITAAVAHLRAEPVPGRRIGGASLGAGLGAPPGRWWEQDRWLDSWDGRMAGRTTAFERGGP